MGSTIPCILGFATFIGSSAFFRMFWPLYLKQHGFNATQLGLLYIPRTTAGMLGSFSYGLLAGKVITPRVLSVLAFIAFTISTFLLSQIPMYPLKAECDGVYTYNGTTSAVPNIAERTNLFDRTSLTPFLSLQCLLVITEFTFATSRVVLNHASMVTLGPMQYDKFGTIRAWGDLSVSIAVLVSGIILNKAASEVKICGVLLHLTDYGYIFYIFAPIALVSCFNSAFLFPEMVNSSGGSEKGKRAMSYGKLFSLLSPDSLSWLILYACRSSFLGISEIYLPWRLADIDTSPFVIGLCGSAKKLTSFLSFLVSSRTIRQFGYVPIAIFATISYVTRFVVYALMTNGLIAVPFSILEGAVLGCFVSAVTAKISSFYPLEGQSPLHGLLTSINVLFLGIGYVSGGLLANTFGTTALFLIFAACSAVTFMTFAMFQSMSNLTKCKRINNIFCWHTETKS